MSDVRRSVRKQVRKRELRKRVGKLFRHKGPKEYIPKKKDGSKVELPKDVYSQKRKGDPRSI
jgi:hypothetical protein